VKFADVLRPIGSLTEEQSTSVEEAASFIMNSILGTAGPGAPPSCNLVAAHEILGHSRQTAAKPWRDLLKATINVQQDLKSEQKLTRARLNKAAKAMQGLQVTIQQNKAATGSLQNFVQAVTGMVDGFQAVFTSLHTDLMKGTVKNLQSRLRAFKAIAGGGSDGARWFASYDSNFQEDRTGILSYYGTTLDTVDGAAAESALQVGRAYQVGLLPVIAPRGRPFGRMSDFSFGRRTENGYEMTF
jgi:hypothetical protein